MERSYNFITTSDAANLLCCTVQHVRRLIQSGKLKGQKVGRDWLADEYSVKEYVAKRCAIAESMSFREPHATYALFPDSEIQVVNVSSVPQRSPFRYPGGKTWLIPTMRKWLANQPYKPQILVEPFAGGGSIGLLGAFEDYVKKSVLVELDPRIAAVWKVMLSSHASALADRVLSFTCTLDSVIAELNRVDESSVDEAFKILLRNRVSRGGILAAGAGFTNKGEGGKGIASRWYPKTLRDRILSINRMSNRIQFIEGDGIKVMKQYQEDPHSIFFIDPPYVKAGKRLYTHFDLEHRQLFEQMSKLKGNFLATYDNHEEIARLANEFGFQTMLIPMKSTHHATKYELLISRDLSSIC